YSTGAGDGGFWTDTEQIKYHVRKAGLMPAETRYRLLLQNKPGRPDVAGWSRAKYRSTDGFVCHSLGSTIEHNGLGGNAAYWRKS
ncbi:MAG: HORMA domain containing protein, partial [Methyloceanibacter sp.]